MAEKSRSAFTSPEGVSEKVEMPAVLSGFFDHVHENPSEADRPGSERWLGSELVEMREHGGRGSTSLTGGHVQRTDVADGVITTGVKVPVWIRVQWC
jgi:hypothetical protein